MISSKQVLARTGISRATLNNYISLGILSKPLVVPPSEEGEEAPLMGYFPEAVVERIHTVQKLKGEGLNMAQIAAAFAPPGGGPEARAAERPEPAVRQAVRPTAVPAAPEEAGAGSLHVQLEDVGHPAYMLNYNLEVVWYNEAARRELLGFDTPPPDSASRHIFLRLLQRHGGSPGLRELVRLHLELGHPRLSRQALLGMLGQFDLPFAEEVAALGADEAPDRVTVKEIAFSRPQADGTEAACVAHGVYFREGVLVVHVPQRESQPDLLRFLSRRDVVIRELLRKRLPVLTPLAVLVADLQGSVRICSELPPEEYFELINEIWARMAPILRRFAGTHGKHVGDGLVYYFFPQPDRSYLFDAVQAACAMREEMRAISKQWQLRKSWSNELYLNVGLHEGQEWLGTFQSATTVEFAVLGDTINHAARLCDFARYGAIWATKNLVSKLSAAERARIEFGIGRPGPAGQEHFVRSSYAQLGSLLDLASERHEKLRDIAGLAIAELRVLRAEG